MLLFVYRPVIFSVDKGQVEHCTADFVLATLTESPAESSATNTETTTAYDRNTSTALPPDSDLDTTFASQTQVPASRPVSRFSNNVTSSSVSVDSQNKITRRTGHRRPSSGRDAERATQPADLVGGLFDIENADEVLEQEVNADSNQWFSHHQGTIHFTLSEAIYYSQYSGSTSRS